MALSTTNAEIITALEADFPIKIKPSGAKITLSEIERIGRIADVVEGTPFGFLTPVDVEHGGRLSGRVPVNVVNYVLFIVTTTQGQDLTAAFNLSQDTAVDIAGQIPQYHWGATSASNPSNFNLVVSPKEVKCVNLTTGSTTDFGFSIWGVKWPQPVLREVCNGF